MVTYWQQEDGKLVKKSEEELDSSKKTWVDARSVTRDDIQNLQDKYKIDPENMLDILDPDELSRIERNEEYDYILAIMKLPVFSPVDDVSYFTAPLGIIITGQFFITICWTDCEVLKDFAANRIKELSLNDFPAFCIRFMARADVMFLRYLKELNRRATSIQSEMLRSVQNHELIQLLNIQKSLVYFSTSLKSNQMLLEKMRKTKVLKLDDEDQDWIDDVEIDNRQAMEMANTYSQIITGTMDAFASVISNNMNMAMKQLTVFSIALMLISFITSFWGMNIRLPWSSSDSWTGFIVISIGCAVLAIASFLLMTFMSRIQKKIRRHKNKK